MKRALCIALLLSGCASAQPAEEIPHVDTQPLSPDAALVQTYVQQQESLRDELVHPAVGARTVDCARVCELSGSICALSGRICAITARHAGEEDMDRACSEAADRCAMARAETTAASCTCDAK